MMLKNSTMAGRSPYLPINKLCPSLAFSMLLLVTAQASAQQPSPVVVSDDDIKAVIAPLSDESSGDAADDEETPIKAMFASSTNLQPAPAVRPTQDIAPLPSSAPTASSGALRVSQRSVLEQGPRFTSLGPAADRVSATEGPVRNTTDAGSLLGTSPTVKGVGTQRRNPIVNDPRIRGNRIGELAASGSYWVPGRIDLDTAVSKLDSTMIDQVTVIRGPYTARHGPGRSFVDIDLARSPRFADGVETHFLSGLNYQTNGEQLSASEVIWGGDKNSGYRAGYVHRTGNDYTAADGTGIPSSYNSREFDLALGYNLSDDESIEFNYLRLDQTGVELAGQAFDIDYLITDGFTGQYTKRNGAFCDLTQLEVWYNNTRFEGDAQNAGKRRFFPIYDVFNYVGNTDVASISSGYNYAMSWGDPEDTELTLGTDLRVVNQRLQEVASGSIGFNVFTDANSPIPKSQSEDAGVYVELRSQVRERLSVRAGARADWVHTDVLADPATLQFLGNYTNNRPFPPTSFQPSFSDIVGTNDWEQNFSLLSGFLSAKHDLDEEWSLLSGAGVGRRPPSLTELYAAQPFMFLLQNGLTTVTGDPLLKDETFAQVDLGFQYEGENYQMGLNGFHTWALNYITFEQLNYLPFPDQENLKYVNTDLATFVGCEAYAQYQMTDHLQPFMNFRYVDGRDRTRNGDFATVQAQPGTIVSPPTASTRDYSLVRGQGQIGNTLGGAEEPLPGILPFDSRLGVRSIYPYLGGNLGGEISSRIVGRQNRVATSLLETPTPGFALGDLRVYYETPSKSLLYASVENFTNVLYREHLDYRSRNTPIRVLQPGINFTIGGQLQF